MFRNVRTGEETPLGTWRMSNIRLRDGRTATAAVREREFWRNVLLAGGFTALPQWTIDPVPGVGEHESIIPEELTLALRNLVNEMAVSLSSALLTAHAKVIGALSGEREISTGYAVRGGSALPCRLTIGSSSWRQALLEIN